MKWIGAKLFFERIFLKRLNNPGSDTDKFLVAKSDGEVGFRTGAEVLSDIGSGDITSVSFTGDSGSQVDNASGAVEFAIEGGDGISTTMGTNKVTISGWFIPNRPNSVYVSAKSAQAEIERSAIL